MMLYDVLWCCMMLYDVIAVDFIPELCVFQLNAKLKPSYIPRCRIFIINVTKKFLEKNFIIMREKFKFQKIFERKLGPN